ncbi:MAG TPA: glutamate--tRNA ligase [Gaiellaceae bacterium]|nr:glutamate--tRNA ligase [Gaiellaceae bacterium]
MVVRARFAPSPTGYLHVGGARTALFNWLFARHEGGEFRLRIENTDTSREVAEAVDQIRGTLAWLGLDHDGPVTFQLDRVSEAQAAARRLVDEGRAYEDEGAIRFRMPDEGVTVWDDIVLGRIEVPSEELDDLVIVRSDGRPTYNFVSPLEDALDGVTHVIRGQDHVSNTPKQLRILEALGADLPRYAHVPLLNGPDGRKLSKRHGAITVEDFREQGYIPEAFVNFLALLGWSYDDRTEVMTRGELVERFTLERVGKSPAVFDYDKLSHLNGLYLRALPPADYADRLVAYLRERGYEWDEQLIRGAAPLVQEKIETLGEFPAYAGFFFARIESEGEVDGQVLPAAAETLAAVEPFEAGQIEAALRGLAERLGLKPREAFQPIRVAVTGSTVSPGLFESLELLGREESLARLEGSGRGGARGSSAR